MIDPGDESIEFMRALCGHFELAPFRSYQIGQYSPHDYNTGPCQWLPPGSSAVMTSDGKWLLLRSKL